MVFGLAGGKGNRKYDDFMAYAPARREGLEDDALGSLNTAFGTQVAYGRK